MQDSLRWLAQLASTVYGGTVVAFAVLLAVYPRATGRPAAEVARVWRAAGPILGIAMGAWVLGQLGGRYVERGEIAWSLAQPWDAAKWAVFVGLWASSFVCEIWTMEPLRRCWSDQSGVTDPVGFERGYRATRGHVAVNGVLFVVWTVLAVVAG